MREIPLRARDGTVRAVALVDDEDYEYLAQWRWHVRAGYAVSTVYLGAGRATTKSMHCELLGLHGVDHEDGDGLNNQRANLRPATQTQNGQNRRVNRNSRSEVRGVTAQRGRWLARVQVAGHSHFLGLHSTVAEARVAVERFRAEHMPYSKEARDAATGSS